jgi:hypothetical protein
LELYIYTGTAPRLISLMPTPLSVLMEASLVQLATLADSLADDLKNLGNVNREALSPEQELCKDTLLTIRVLLPKLQTAAWAKRASEIQASARCVDCDENS